MIRNDPSTQQIYAEMAEIMNRSSRPEEDHEYESLLKNKSVAIVGPAKTTIGSLQGPRIDSYDLVVRFNEAFEHLPIAPDLALDIGTRSDILYCNQVILRKNILRRKKFLRPDFIKICNQAGIQYLLCSNNSLSYARTGEPTPGCDLQDQRVIADLKRLIDRPGVRTRFRLVHAASEKLMRWMRGYWGRTGFVAILDLLSFDISRLYVTGMTFYHGGGHLYAADDVELHPLKNRDGSWAGTESIPGHNSTVELEILKMLARCFGQKLELDETLRTLLENNCE